MMRDFLVSDQRTNKAILGVGCGIFCHQRTDGRTDGQGDSRSWIHYSFFNVVTYKSRCGNILIIICTKNVFECLKYGPREMSAQLVITYMQRSFNIMQAI